MRYITWTRAVAVMLLLGAACLPALAIEERPMPEFTVNAPDGAAVASAQLTPTAQYVLMYVAPNCRPCDRLLALLKDTDLPQLPSRVVIIVRGDAASGAAYIRSHVPAEAGQVMWYADPDGQASKALRLTGTPVLIGVRGPQIIWSVSGVLNDASTVQSVVGSWVSY
jgi:hypothetical protein